MQGKTFGPHCSTWITERNKLHDRSSLEGSNDALPLTLRSIFLIVQNKRVDLKCNLLCTPEILYLRFMWTLIIHSGISFLF